MTYRTMSLDQPGVCIVGTGDMAGKHAAGWQKVPRARLVSVAGHSPARADEFVSRWGLDTWHSDYRDAIARDDVQVVSVCVPTHLHADIAVFAARQGKHILCEKPIALTLTDADRMIDAARANGVSLGVGFMRHYSPAQQALQRLVTEGHLGRPLMVHATDIRETRPKTAMHDPAQNGGPIIDLGVHHFNGWAHLFGAPAEQVFAQGLTLSAGRPRLAHLPQIAPDTAAITVRYQSGDIGVLVIAWGLPPGIDQQFVPDRIFGPEALAEIELDPALPQQSLRLKSSAAGGQWQTIAQATGSMFDLEIADFARRLQAGQPPALTGADGRAALAVALAATESLRTGQPQKL